MADQLGGLVMVALVLLLAVLCLSTRLPRRLRWLGLGGLFVRIVGVAAMLAIIFSVYNGVADAIGYLKWGSQYAERMLDGDFRMFTRVEWYNGVWWGAHIVNLVSAMAQVLLGPGSFGIFLLFSLFAFAGLCLFAAAFARTYPQVPVWKYARWLFFFPSLWLWPSAIGKDALILLGLGLLAYGYFRRGRVAWVPSTMGMLLIFVIRPQVAAVVAFSVILAEWLGRDRRWSVLRVAEGVVIVALGVFLMTSGFLLVQGEGGMSGAGEYLQRRAAISAEGGSGIEAAGVGITAIPRAFVTTLLRPFPWEAKNLMALGSALEIWIFWAVALFRWRRIAAALREWRSTRFMAMGLPFVLIYAVAFGMVMYNLGIVARQRIFLFPFLFAMLEAFPAPARQHRRTGSAPVARQPTPHLIPERAL